MGFQCMPVSNKSSKKKKPSKRRVPNKRAKNGKQAATKQSADTPKKPARFGFSIKPGTKRAISAGCAKLFRDLEGSLGRPLWVIWEEGGAIDNRMYESFLQEKCKMAEGEDIALIIESPGGFAGSAYNLALFLRKHCGGFQAVIPRYAKSAATLLALGGDSILMSEYAEIGPIDPQIFDHEKSEFTGALDEVQSLEYLHEIALQEIDSTMHLFQHKMPGKKAEVVLPLAIDFVVSMKAPMLEKLNTVHYTTMLRRLKISEEYAHKLLKNRYQDQVAVSIARNLVHGYPEHGFVIDSIEATDLGLDIQKPTEEQEDLFIELRAALQEQSLVGRVEEF